jgi:DNA-binding CsgD family transcriptional regulator
MFAVALMVAAEYDEALERLEVAIREVERFRLEFCLPHILVIRAGAQLGQRDFRAASAQLDEVAQMPSTRDEPHVVMNAAALRARLLLAIGRANDAAEATEREWAALPSAVMYGEYLASHALALACCGSSERALAAADRADQISQQLDSRALTTWTRAIIALHQERSDTEEVLAASGDFLRVTGHADSFVAAYRGFPPLVNRLRPYVRDVELSGILHRANDFALAEQLGLRVPTDKDGVRLTPREQEVHRLVAQGKTNREIATALFITEATVKVHVRHILEKLGARSRTEAAVKEVSRQLR